MMLWEMTRRVGYMACHGALTRVESRLGMWHVACRMERNWCSTHTSTAPDILWSTRQPWHWISLYLWYVSGTNLEHNGTTLLLQPSSHPCHDCERHIIQGMPVTFPWSMWPFLYCVATSLEYVVNIMHAPSNVIVQLVRNMWQPSHACCGSKGLVTHRAARR